MDDKKSDGIPAPIAILGIALLGGLLYMRFGHAKRRSSLAALQGSNRERSNALGVSRARKTGRVPGL